VSLIQPSVVFIAFHLLTISALSVSIWSRVRG